MFKINEPVFSHATALAECISGVTGNPRLAQSLEAEREQLMTLGEHYIGLAKLGDLASIQPMSPDASQDEMVVGTLSKSDLIKAYTQYFVPEAKPARRIYDYLLNCTQDRCPFCGGLGVPANLDHYLPKDSFPQFSVLPVNLVPSCRDCNIGEKGTYFAVNPEEQFLQPYVDDPKYFEEQWVWAKYIPDADREAGNFEYFVRAPECWSALEAQRAKTHFIEFGIGRRFAVRAAQNLRAVLEQIRRLKRSHLQLNDIIHTLLQPEIDEAEFVNHWKPSMYQALIQHLTVEFDRV